MQHIQQKFTLKEPLGFFMYEARKISIGTRADVINVTLKARIEVNVVESSDCQRSW